MLNILNRPEDEGVPPEELNDEDIRDPYMVAARMVNERMVNEFESEEILGMLTILVLSL